MKNLFVGHPILKQAKNHESDWSQCHRVLTSSLLSPSQKQCETYPSREQKNAVVFANRISWRKITITSLAEVTAASITNVKKEKNRYCECYIKFCMQVRNILTNLSPNPVRARPEIRPDLKSPARLTNSGDADQRKLHSEDWGGRIAEIQGRQAMLLRQWLHQRECGTNENVACLFKVQ